MRRTLLSVPVVVAAVLMAGVVLAQSNPAFGTWKLDTSKSKYTPGPAPKSLTVKLEPNGEGLKSSAEGTSADGSHTAWSYTANYDGKDNPISGAGPGGADTIAIKRIDPNTTESTFKKAGKVVRTSRLVVSGDGKVLKITGKGTQDGKPVSSALVFDKQ